MKSLGLAGSSMPRAKAGDFDMALQLLTIFGNDKARKQYMTEMRDAKVATDTARDDAQAAERNAAERDKAAQAAEADAIRARQALADETAKVRDELGKRDVAVTERERVAGGVEKSQGMRDADLKRRERHLNEAGVRGF